MKLPAFFQKTAVFLLLTFFAPSILAQEAQTKVRGKVSDANTGEPIPFVSIVFKGTSIGCITDFDGEYYIEARTTSDSIIASYIGYKPQIFAIKRKQYQLLDIKLEPADYQLNEIVVRAGEDPAVLMFRKIQDHKENNNPARFENYEYEVYNKMELDVNNIDEEFKKRRVFREFQFVFEHLDTSAITGKSYLPVFLTETLSDFYYQEQPKRQKEVIKASKISGVTNESVSQYTGQMYLKINIFDNYLEIAERQFVSPLANFGLLTYKYYLIDSTFIDNQWCYLLTFEPRRKQELTFTGEMWIHDTTFAVKRIRARIADDANINFVNDLVITQEFTFVDRMYWHIDKDELFIDFNISDQQTGFFGRKTTSYRNIKINQPRQDGFYSRTEPEEFIVQANALEKGADFWHDARHETLSQREENIYGMVDSIRNVPVFRTFVDVVNMLVNYYYVRGNFEFGPYYTLASFNEIEGPRVRLGGRTSNEFSTDLMLTGHVAYGFKDERFKYGIGGLYLFNKSPRSSVSVNFKHDIEQLGQSQNAFMNDNILASLLQRNPRYKLTMVRQFDASFDKEWFLGFSNKLNFTYRQIFPSDSVKFESTENHTTWSQIITSELRLNTRLAYDEKFLSGEFERVSLGSEFPIVNIGLTLGLKDFLHADNKYLKADLNIQHDFDINPFGRFNLIMEAGKIWGTVPYPLLRLHEGNETYAFDDYAFNMMNYYEFASDTWASAYAEDHFQGFFLNKVPLLRKLKLREVLYGKAIIGSISHKNYGVIMDFPYTLQDLNKPYYEAGFGIENILKVIRIDAVWRLSHLDNQNIAPFGLRMKLQIII